MFQDYLQSNQEAPYFQYIKSRKNKRRKKRIIKLLILIIILLIPVLNLFSILNKTSNNIFTNTNKSLRATVEKSLEGSKGTYAVVIKNLKSKEGYQMNEQKVFEAGSLYKLWIMATVVKNLQTGELKEDEKLIQAIEVLNKKFSIELNLAEQTEGVITLTVADALKQMITISHNYAALLLSENVKLSKVASFLDENSFKQSKIATERGSPTTTALDIALFFEKLYKGELANEQYTNKMLDLLKSQKLNDKLPKYLPKETLIAHKTGEIGWFSHDVGIVYTPNGDYIIVVLSESDSPPGAEEKIAELSKAVYEYFQSKNI